MVWTCVHCNRDYADKSVRAHLLTKKHQNNLNARIVLTQPIQNNMDISDYVDKLFQRAERVKQWEEYKFTPMYERTFYV